MRASFSAPPESFGTLAESTRDARALTNHLPTLLSASAPPGMGVPWESRQPETLELAGGQVNAREEGDGPLCCRGVVDGRTPLLFLLANVEHIHHGPQRNSKSARDQLWKEGLEGGSLPRRKPAIRTKT
eukprot:scaffold4196_cov245-Pinguiococcus_pyrenoidosus.AAC.2